MMRGKALFTGAWAAVQSKADAGDVQLEPTCLHKCLGSRPDAKCLGSRPAAFFVAAALQLMRHIQSLGILLGVARSAAAAQGQQLELLRKESLEGECCCLLLLLPAGITAHQAVASRVAHFGRAFAVHYPCWMHRRWLHAHACSFMCVTPDTYKQTRRSSPCTPLCHQNVLQ
jgi:hypothetical protein